MSVSQGKEIIVSSPAQTHLNLSSSCIPFLIQYSLNIVDHNTQLQIVFTSAVKGWPDGKPFISLYSRPGSITTCLSIILDVK